MKRACIDCGAVTTGRRCSRCHGGGTGWSHNRSRRAQEEFRTKLITRSGGRCEELDEATGERCIETRDLRACHLNPLADGENYDVENGRMRCRAHDRATDSRAR